MDSQPGECSEPLKVLIENAIYNAYLEKQPGLIIAIDQLVSKGQLPIQIEQWVNKQVPAGSQIGNHAYLIACYLTRLQCCQN